VKPSVLAGLVLAASTAGCWHAHAPTVRPAANLDDDANTPRFFPPPIALAVPEDAIVRLVGPVTTCTGTLVDEDLVLTAHHCVVHLDARGQFTSKTLDPHEIRVELGGDYLPWGDVTIKDIITPPCGERGGQGDVAVVILSHKLVGITPYTVRLDKAPAVGETLDPAGFGRCSLSGDGIRRAVREGGQVAGVQPGTIQMTASICPGDSGGPVFGRGGHEVVGVVSLSAMDSDPRTRNASIMARVDTFRPLFAHARQIADGASRSELPPLTCGE